jgi:hypothetical protein
VSDRALGVVDGDDISQGCRNLGRSTSLRLTEIRVKGHVTAADDCE